MKHIDILSKATKIHTPEGVYDGEAAHWALGELKRCWSALGEISENRDDHELVGKIADDALSTS